jgi:hypothetical protein
MRRPHLVLLLLPLLLVLTAQADERTPSPRLVSTCMNLPDPGSYLLANNLDAAGDCLLLKSNFITLDLNGFTIRGNGTGRGIRSSSSSGRGVTIRNGVVTNFNVGIAALSLNSSIENMRVANNAARGAELTAGIVRGSAFYENADEGLVAVGKTLIVNSTFDRNGAGVVAGFGSQLIGNEASDNTTAGFFVISGSTVADNTATENGGDGMHVECPSSVVRNTATANGTGNITLVGAGCVDSFNVDPN